MKFKIPFGFAILTFALTLGILTGCSKQTSRTDAQVTTEIQAKLYSDSSYPKPADRCAGCQWSGHAHGRRDQ